MDEAIRQHENWQEFVRQAIASALDREQGQESEKDLSDPLIRETLELGLAVKRDALAKETKRRSPDQKLIEKWRSQIEELESVLGNR